MDRVTLVIFVETGVTTEYTWNSVPIDGIDTIHIAVSLPNEGCNVINTIVYYHIATSINLMMISLVLCNYLNTKTLQSFVGYYF